MRKTATEPRGRMARAARWGAAELDAAAGAFGIVIRPGAWDGEEDEGGAEGAARPYVRLAAALAAG